MYRLIHKNNKGFTLMEMLIVVAIIAILIAIAIPVFSSQISKARLATDAANLRTAETLAVADMMAENRGVETLSSTLSIQETPGDSTAVTLPTESCAVYYFDGSGSGIEVAEADTGALATSGTFEGAYDDGLTIVVCVSADGEILASGWTTASNSNG